MQMPMQYEILEHFCFVRTKNFDFYNYFNFAQMNTNKIIILDCFSDIPNLVLQSIYQYQLPL